MLDSALNQLNRPLKTNSMPPEALTIIPTRNPVPRAAEKKASDPTPLRQSTRQEESFLPTSSPEIVEDPLEDEALITTPPKRATRDGLKRDSRLNGSMEQDLGKASESSTGPLLPSAGIFSDQQLEIPLQKLRLPPKSLPARLVKQPSSSSSSTQTAVSDDRSLPHTKALSRTPSAISNAGSMLRTTSISTLSSINPLRRDRSASGPASSTLSLVPNGPTSSAHRKGTTPSRRLKSHTCTWGYDLQHALRIPLGNPWQIPGAANLGKASPTPTLGGGPLSDSGLRFIIEQLPTPAATSAQAATGANPDNVGSMLQAIHHADHANGKGNPSELGKGSREATNGGKSIFGIVDVDLAVFAGKGKMTRSFLLRGSKTNATIKVSDAP